MVRIKHRYIIGQLLIDPNAMKQDVEYTVKDIVQIIREKIQNLFGDYGMGLIGNSLVIKYYDNNSRIFLLKTTRDGLKETWFALSTIVEIKKVALIVRVLNVCSSERTFPNDLKKIYDVICSEVNTKNGANIAANAKRSTLQSLEYYYDLIDNITA